MVKWHKGLAFENVVLLNRMELEKLVVVVLVPLKVLILRPVDCLVLFFVLGKILKTEVVYKSRDFAIGSCDLGAGNNLLSLRFLFCTLVWNC